MEGLAKQAAASRAPADLRHSLALAEKLNRGLGSACTTASRRDGWRIIESALLAELNGYRGVFRVAAGCPYGHLGRLVYGGPPLLALLLSAFAYRPHPRAEVLNAAAVD